MTRTHPFFWLQVLLSVALYLVAAAVAYADHKADRIVSVGGSVTEIIYALGEEDRLVARDTTSNYPAQANALPDVGYIRRLSPEGLLSLGPDLIIALEGSGPPETVELIREAAIDIVEIPHQYTAEGVTLKITTVADALGVPEKGKALADKVSAELADAREAVKASTPKRVLFILSMSGGNIIAAGDETPAKALIELAGGVNALEGVNGFKQLTPEAVSSSNPDVILVMDRKGGHAISKEDISAHPALVSTPAALNGALIKLDGLMMLGFSVRTAEAVTALSRALENTGS